MCGSCCRRIGFALAITARDWRRWTKEGREDILQYVRPLHMIDRRVRFKELVREDEARDIWVCGDAWINPETGDNLNKCPFLKSLSQEKYICTIHDTKPEVCRQFCCDETYGVGKKAWFKGWPYKKMILYLPLAIYLSANSIKMKALIPVKTVALPEIPSHGRIGIDAKTKYPLRENKTCPRRDYVTFWGSSILWLG
jgi:Fe-S-cluster containining protein